MKSRVPSTLCRRAILLLSVLVLLVLCPAAAWADYDSSQREKIRVGFFAMDGYHMVDEQGNRSGYGYDFLQLVARYLDVDFEYVGYEDSWEEMQTMLEKGEIDLLTSARRTAQREERFDFSRPIGSNSAILSIRSDNSRIIMHDFETYNGMRVALLKGNSRNNDFADLAKENGFTYLPVYFASTDDMTQALQSGQVDAVVTSSLRQTQNERIIEKFNTSEFYAIVKKGNTELLDKINYAIDQMNAAEGDWRTELHNRYYENYNNRNLSFTQAEKDIIAQYSSPETPLTVVCDPTRYPYSYVENGRLIGILPDYFRALAEYSGISYTFVPCQTREEYLQRRSDGSSDLCLDLRLNVQRDSEIPGSSVTAPYLTLRMAMVTRSDFNGEINVVSTVDQSAVFDEAYAKDAEKLVCKTREEAMQAVLDGKADAAFVYYYTAQAFVNREKSGALTYTLLEETTYNYHIAVSPQVNHALAGILTKAIYAMPNSLIEDISGQYTAYQAKDITFMMLMQMHPEASIGVGLGLAVIVIVFMTGRIHIQKKQAVEARQKAAEMQILAEKADAANRAKTQFLANMSHDIRTPINGIVGLLKINEAHSGEEALVHENREKMQKAADHLLSLVNDVLQMSKLENGTEEIHLEPVNLGEISHDIVDIIRQSATEKNIAWAFSGDRAPKYPYVMASPLHLRKVFLNIYGNCIKFTGPGGTISTRQELVKEEGGTVTYRWIISDTGVGMSKEFLAHIFEPFSQEKNGARSEYQGTGLGMAIVKHLVEQMGGTISVSSQEGKGSTFVITLPFEITSQPEKKEEPAEPRDISGLHLLMAEDNELNAEIAKTLLEDAGAKLTTVTDGVQAVEAFRGSAAGTFDAILMDIMMPEMDGLTATRTIRSLDRPDAGTIPIIAMTANAFAEDAQRCMEAGMNAHLAKPLDIAKLIAEIARLVKK